MKYLAAILALAASAAIGYRIGRYAGLSQIKSQADAIHASVQKFVDASKAYTDASRKPAPVTPEPQAADVVAPATPDDWNKAFVVDMRREGNC